MAVQPRSAAVCLPVDMCGAEPPSQTADVDVLTWLCCRAGDLISETMEDKPQPSTNVRGDTAVHARKTCRENAGHEGKNGRVSLSGRGGAYWGTKGTNYIGCTQPCCVSDSTTPFLRAQMSRLVHTPHGCLKQIPSFLPSTEHNSALGVAHGERHSNLRRSQSDASSSDFFFANNQSGFPLCPRLHLVYLHISLFARKDKDKKNGLKLDASFVIRQAPIKKCRAWPSCMPGAAPRKGGGTLNSHGVGEV